MSGTITRLVAQRRNPKRINVHVDGVYAAALDLSVVMRAGLLRGQEISDEELARLSDSDSVEKAYDRALVFLSFRPRSTVEVRRNLEARKTPPDVIEQVVERLRGGGMLDDAAFARTWVENRDAFSPRSARLLGYELRQKGVGAEDIEAALPADDDAAAVEAARRKVRQLRNLDFDTFRQKMLSYLQRRGFGYESAAAAVKVAWEEAQGSGELNGSLSQL